MQYTLSLSSSSSFLDARLVSGDGDPGTLSEPAGMLYLDRQSGNVWLAATAEITSGLVTKWDFDTVSGDVSGSTVNDRSGNGNPGTLIGSPAVGAAGITLNGSGSQYVSGGTSSTVLSGDRSVALWFYPTSNSGNIALWESGVAGNGVLINYFTGTLFWSITGGGFINSGLGMNVNAWNLVIVSWNSATSALAMYVNGVKFSGTTTNNNWPLNKIYVGHDGLGIGVIDFIGQVGQMKMWSRQLSDAEAAAVYANHPPAMTGQPDLEAAWTQVGQITANIAQTTDPGPANVKHGVAYWFNDSQETGTYRGYDLWSAVPASMIYLGASYLQDGNTVVGLLDEPDPSLVKLGATYYEGQRTGTYTGADRWSDPGAANVSTGTTYNANGVAQTGTRDTVTNILSNVTLTGQGMAGGTLTAG